MNQEQLKVAAYKYCELLGIDPSESVQAPNHSVNGMTVLVMRSEQRWQAVARMINEAWAVNSAIDFALKKVSK